MKANISRRSFVLGGTGVLAGLGLTSLVGCAQTGDMATTTASEGIMTASSAYSSAVIRPMPVIDNLSHSVGWHVYEGLYQLDHATGEIYNGIAKSDPVKTSDSTYEIEIDLEKRFSDGSFVNARTITAVLGAYMNDDIYKIIFDFMRSIEIVADDKLKINLNYQIDSELLKCRLCTALIYKQGSQSNGADESYVGTGPYVLKDADGADGHTVQFTPNGMYSGEKPPRASGMNWNCKVDDEARVKQLVDGASALVEDIPYRMIDEIKSKGFEIKMQDSYNMPTLFFNTKHAPFNDVKIRQAVLYAINSEKIIKDFVDGYAEVPQSYLPKFNQDSHVCENVYNYNPAKAKELLTEAGRPNLYFNLIVNPYASAEVFVEEIKRNLSDVGITCNYKIQEINWETFMKPEFSDEYDSFLCAVDPSILGNDTDTILSTFLGDNALMHNITYWSSTEPDQYNQLQHCLNQGRSLSGNEQKDAWDKAQEIVAKQVPIYPILHRKICTAYNAKLIKDYKGNISSGLYLLDAAPVK